MEQLRYGILSTSSIAPRFIDAVRREKAGQILALSSRTLEKAQEKAALWDIPVAYGSHQQLLEDPHINIIYISTVNALHHTWAKAALEHGKHVICEKPCTTTQEQTRELFQLAREKGLFFMEAQKMLLLPAIRALKEQLEAGVLGTVTMAGMRHSFPASYNSWMLDPAAGGGTLLSSGIYATELLTWLFGQITSISGTAVKATNGAEQQYLLTGFANNVQFSIQNSSLSMLDNTLRIGGSLGWAEIPEYWKARKLILHFPAAPAEVLEFPCENELVYEAKHIYECVTKGLLTSPVVTEQITLAGIEALQAVKASWQEAR